MHLWTVRSAVSQGTFPDQPCYVSVSELQQNPGGCLGVHERYPAPSGAQPRHLVHQPIPSSSAGLERGIEIRYAVANVMNPGTSPGQKLADGTIRLHRRKQLNLRISEGKGDDGCAIHHLRRMRLEPK